MRHFNLEKYTPMVVAEYLESVARAAMDKAVNPIHTSFKRCDRVLEVYAGTVGVSAENQCWFSKVVVGGAWNSRR